MILPLALSEDSRGISADSRGAARATGGVGPPNEFRSDAQSTKAL